MPQPAATPTPRRAAWALLPAGVAPWARALLLARALRALADGALAVLLPAYLLALGFSPLTVGVLSTATLLGSALATLAVGAWGHRWAPRQLLRGAALLMAATGVGFTFLDGLAPLLVLAFVGTLNPSSGDVSVFLPLEHARLAQAARGEARTALFARYSVLAAACAAVGALGAGLPQLLTRLGLEPLTGLRLMFFIYGLLGLALWALYGRLPAGDGAAAADGAATSAHQAPRAERVGALGPSRPLVLRLALLFSVDSFAGGLLVNSLLALWLLQRFGLQPAQAGLFFFATGLLSAASQLAAPRLARRIGLLHTMVFTHLPANVCLVLAALAPGLPLALGLLLVRAALSQMDVPARGAFVMAVVTPAERTAAASFTAVPRSLAAALSPSLSAALLAGGFTALPLLLCGLLKIGYDLTLWRACRHVELQG
ncbi:MFS transporter [Azohydromonas caseinilytica]|uniref:MFS transporter n=1 Tax=Azohydromonas caseinilytica TaxID=2728836 RepID=A0A848F6P6_9BURK|nr:MFS transporter [Azohydromonas caseinilytica]NML13761.1 MFS transporter [Azohydromonas caseinilytica]